MMRRNIRIDGWELDEAADDQQAAVRKVLRVQRSVKRARRMIYVYYFLAVIGGAMALLRLLPDETRQAIWDAYVAPAFGIEDAHKLH